MKQYTMGKKKLVIFSVLSFFIMCTQILAQKRKTIELKVNKQNEYDYELNGFLIVNGLTKAYTQAISNLTIGQKNKDGNFTIKEKIKALNIVSSGETIFSFGISFEPYSRQSLFQQYIKNNEFESVIDQNGKVVKPWDLSLLENDIILNSHRKEELIKQLTQMSLSANIPYLNRPLINGDTFKIQQKLAFIFKESEELLSTKFIDQKDSLSLEINYKVIEMDKKQTLLYFYYNGGLLRTKIEKQTKKPLNANIRGMLLIDNKTGMPKLMRQLVNVDKYSYVSTLNRPGEKTVDVSFWEYLKNNPSSTSINKDTVPFYSKTAYIKDEKAFKDSIDKIDISFHFLKHGYWGNKKRLKVNMKDADFFLFITPENIKCYHTNRQVSDLINYQDISQTTISYIEGHYQDAVPFSNMGDYAEIDSVVLNCNLKGYIGLQNKELKHSDVGKDINLEEQAFRVLKWEKNTIKVQGWDWFHFYGKDGKKLETFRVSLEYNYIKQVSKFLSIPENQLTIEQCFLFAGINGESCWERTVEYYCPEDIEKVVYFEPDRTIELKKTYVVRRQ